MVRACACVAAAEHGNAEECARHVHRRVHTLQLVNFWRDPVRATRVSGGASRRVPGLSYPRAGIHDGHHHHAVAVRYCYERES